MKKNLYKQILSVFLVLILAFQCLLSIRAEEISDENIVIIETEEDLRQMAEKCTLDSWSRGKTFVLRKDIQLTTDNFLPIATFGGIFEGNGYTISGINMNGSLSPAGFLGVVQKEGVVKNLNIQGRITPTLEADDAGGIVGICYGTIIGCNFQGSIVGESNIGGIAGVLETGAEIRNCKVQGTITGDHSTGGIVGWNKGTVLGCQNNGSVNVTGEDVEVDMPELNITTIMNINSTDNTAMHTDTGGIAGFSEGKIYYCINEGTIGYQHVGYNVGGITGRSKQSYIQNCTNAGSVLGRKDVGGITGQIEPLLEVEYMTDKFQILDQEIDKFMDLLEKTYVDMDSMGSQTVKLIKDISYYVNTARVAAGGLSADSEVFYDDFNQNMDGMNKGVEKLREDLNEIDWGNDENISVSGNQFPSVSGNGLPSIPGNQLPSISGNEVSNFYEDEINASKDAIDNFLGATGETTSNMNQSSIEYSEDVKYHMSAINANLEEAEKKLDELSKVLLQGGAAVSQDMADVIQQARKLQKVVNEIRDDMFQYEDIKIQDVSEEKESKEIASIGAENIEMLTSEKKYDTSSFQKGKLERCLNTGTVEADINVGGIVGLMATEYDVDPEDDIEVMGDTSTKVSKTAKLVIRDSKNEGEIIAKKDCVGGIVGKAEVGAIISCEAYGNVKSISGDYVGGIAGEFIGNIKNCYVKCVLAGNSYIGGIVGCGSDDQDAAGISVVSNCYSMIGIEEGKQYLGAIAGIEKGEFNGNYFVSDTLQGINRINYSQKAEPIAFELVQSKEDVAKEFKTLTVKFMVEDKVIKTKEFAYGQTLSNHIYPEIPEKEGYYSIWDRTQLRDLKMDAVVRAKYIPYITVVSGDIYREDGRPIFFAEGNFKKDDILKITDKTEQAKSKGIKNNTGFIKEDNVLEHWSLNIPNYTKADKFVIHYLKDESNKKINIFIHENKQWKKVIYEEEGSYYLFEVPSEMAEIIISKR